jgi:hypothetical protein
VSVTDAARNHDDLPPGWTTEAFAAFTDAYAAAIVAAYRRRYEPADTDCGEAK